MIEFQDSAKEDRQSFYDHTKDPLGSIRFYEGLKDRLLMTGVPVKSVDIDISAEDLKGQDMEYVEWSGEYQLALRLNERLFTLKSIENVT